MVRLMIQSGEKIRARKLAMIIFVLAPILSWYRIPFPVGLGSALILFCSVYIIISGHFNINVLPKTFWAVYIYICFLWSYNHNFELFSLLPPGGWIFSIFVLGLIGGIQIFDITLCRRYMQWVVRISIVLFYIQLTLLFTTGSSFCFVPPITSEFTYESMTYAEIVARQLSSSHPCSVFLEKSYMAYYLVAYLCLSVFDESPKNVIITKESLCVIITLILLRSGSGLVGLSVLLIGKVFTLLWEKSVIKRIALFCIIVPFSVCIFYVYSRTESGQEILSRQEELSTEGTSGYSRVMAGYMIYDLLSPEEQMLGKSDAKDVFGKESSDGKNKLYINGVQTILISLGIIGAILYLIFYVSIYNKICLSSRMCILILLTMGSLESNYLNPYMLLLTIIPCSDYYLKKKLQ